LGSEEERLELTTAIATNSSLEIKQSYRWLPVELEIAFMKISNNLNHSDKNTLDLKSKLLISCKCVSLKYKLPFSSLYSLSKVPPVINTSIPCFIVFNLKFLKKYRH
jgi:hypothetical protein